MIGPSRVTGEGGPDRRSRAPEDAIRRVDPAAPADPGPTPLVTRSNDDLPRPGVETTQVVAPPRASSGTAPGGVRVEASTARIVAADAAPADAERAGARDAGVAPTGVAPVLVHAPVDVPLDLAHGLRIELDRPDLSLPPRPGQDPTELPLPRSPRIQLTPGAGSRLDALEPPARAPRIELVPGPRLDAPAGAGPRARAHDSITRDLRDDLARAQRDDLAPDARDDLAPDARDDLNLRRDRVHDGGSGDLGPADLAPAGARDVSARDRARARGAEAPVPPAFAPRLELLSTDARDVGARDRARGADAPLPPAFEQPSTDARDVGARDRARGADAPLPSTDARDVGARDRARGADASVPPAFAPRLGLLSTDARDVVARDRARGADAPVPPAFAPRLGLLSTDALVESLFADPTLRGWDAPRLELLSTDALVDSLFAGPSFLERLQHGRVQLRRTGPQPRAWEQRATAPALAPGEVHLWLARVDDLPREAVLSVLSPDEEARARGFRSERDGRRSAASAALLRHVLGAHLGLAPDGVPLGRAEGGKPLLLSDGHALAFNLSHSGDLILLAVAERGPVGVDLEGLELAPPDAAQLASAWFHAAEADHLRGLEASARAGTFLALWTRKEAFGKARGDGLASSVGPGPRVDPTLPRQRLVARDGRAWLCLDLALPGAAVGAVVVPWHEADTTRD